MRIKNTVTELIGGTPLLRLQRMEEKLGCGANLIAKVEFFNPAGSIKDRVGFNMITEAEKSGRLKPGGTIIEPVSYTHLDVYKRQAVLSAVTGLDSGSTCGRGGGINEDSFRRKRMIVDKVSEPYRSRGGAIEILKARHDEKSYHETACDMMLEILARMGGFDIRAMTGAFIGAACRRLPVVIDGYISVVAALAAYVMAPACRDYMFASHISMEKGYLPAVELLGLEPFLALDMRLGEGSGCPVAFEVIRGACDVMRNMATFEAVSYTHLSVSMETGSLQSWSNA